MSSFKVQGVTHTSIKTLRGEGGVGVIYMDILVKGMFTTEENQRNSKP